MSDAQLTPLQQWLVEVAAQAKQRPWWTQGFGDMSCSGCGCAVSSDRYHRTLASQNHGHDRCVFLALDAALDKEPQP